jgi:hypothetical protein
MTATRGAYRELILNINGKNTTLHGAFHMDKAPMTLLGTTRSSKESPPVMRRRVYMTQHGDLVRWTGEINQPDIHHMYGSNFNAVDVHNKLSVEPRSVCKVATGSLPLKLWLYLVACAETNAYLMYTHHHKLSSEQYNHAKFDLEGELLQCALEDGAVSAEAGVCTRRGDGMDSGATHTGEQSVPASFQGVRSLAVLACECSETCIMGMHVFNQDDLISIAQFDLDQHQNISSPQTECNSLLSLCPYIKHRGTPAHMSKVSTTNAWCVGTGQSGFVVVAGPFVGRSGRELVILGKCKVSSRGIWGGGCAVATWQEGMGLSISLACL